MQIKNLGLVDYRKAYEDQLEQVEKVKAEGNQETLIVCSHPPVVTLGKKSTPEDLIGWTGQIENIERGGKATYHGPSQVVIYPILDLKVRNQDIAGFLAAMENAMIECLQSYDLKAQGNTERGKPDYTGVWVEYAGEMRKIASIGVAVKRWITYHGLAFNLFKDEGAFSGIKPCGFTTETMISLEDILSEDISRTTFEEQLCQLLIKNFNQLRKD